MFPTPVPGVLFRMGMGIAHGPIWVGNPTLARPPT
jgi:hypothetical protein